MVPKITVASHSHHRSIAHLQYLSHTESFSDFAEKSWIQERRISDYQDFWDTHLQNQGPRELTWVMLGDHQTLGTISIISLENSSRLFRPSNLTSQAEEDVACLRLMYIHPDHIRRGYGSQLIKVATSFMQEKQYQQGVLITHAANQRARNFYEANGWVLDRIIDQQVDEFYQDPPKMRLRARYHYPL